MEPHLPSPGPSPEMGGYNRPETPSIPAQEAPRSAPEVIRERPEQHEVQPVATPTSAVPTQAPMQLPAPPQPQAVQSPPANQTDNNPLAAADDDLLEKEWVDRAKKIVQDTKNDPHQQEDQVSRLQADYIKKRYGKDIKLTHD